MVFDFTGAIHVFRLQIVRHFTANHDDIFVNFVYDWPTVYDAESTVNQRWVNVSCLLATN